MVADSPSFPHGTHRAIERKVSSAPALAPSRLAGLALAVVVAVVTSTTLAATQPLGVPAGTIAARTPWGDPDLQGVWDFRTLTPIERPATLAGQRFFTPEEAATIERNAREGGSAWLDYGAALVEDRRTSLIVSPTDGRIPWTPRMRTRIANFAQSYPEGPEDQSLAERCLVGFNSGPPMLPSAYNNNVHVLQTSDHVVILNEMIHSARIVPLGGQPHLTPEFRHWVGDARGHWEGDTLVVETTNFPHETIFLDSSAKLRLVERFALTDDNTLLYEFTLDDPAIWTEPWTAAVPMKRSERPMFEYACHEGNYGMQGMLAGTRAAERGAADAQPSRTAR